LGALGVVAAAVAKTSACSSEDSSSTLPTSSVIVIGGGLSGLVSAYLLGGRGVKVSVLEANHHPGGRVHTERWPNGQISELGFEEFFDEDTYPDIWWFVR
jgi:monoamine oxidase